MQSLEEELRRFVIDNFFYGRATRFHNRDSFLDLGIVDSTGMLELVAYVEKTYGIQVEDADLIPENLDSVALLAQFVARKVQRTPASPSIVHAEPSVA